MLMRNISQAKSELSALLEEVLKGREVLIAKAGKPIAKLVPYNGAPKRRTPGALKGKIKIGKDFDSLPDDIAESFGATVK